MKGVFVLALIFGVVFSGKYAFALQKPGEFTCENLELGQKKIVRFACVNGKTYEIEYKPKKASILLKYSGQEISLARITAQFNPELVGSDIFIGFLEPGLQVYKNLNLIMYVTSIRTSGGGGGGQCGSGSEIFLNFLDVSKAKPKRYSSILIGSCDKSIELFDQNISDREFGEVFVDAGKIHFKFMNYKNVEGYPVAAVSTDFSRLDFK